MAKKSVKNRNQKRAQVLSRFRGVRDKLREDVSNVHLSEKEHADAVLKLQKN